MKNTQIKDGLRERLYWLIGLRWVAIAGVVATVIFVTNILRLSIGVFPIYIVTLVLGLCNLAYLISLNFIIYTPSPRQKSNERANYILANIQIFLDLTFLASLIHFSGGIENPFIFYFIFHMIIASILLTRRASFLQATYAVLLFSIMVTSEYLEILPHYSLEGFIPNILHNNRLYITGVSFVFITTLYIAVYMATSISSRLREREKSLEEANILLKQKDRIKSEYVLRVTHDIKEHLSAVQSCIEPVTKGITGSLNERQKDLLFRARGRAQKLLFFVRALLEITRIKLDKGLEIEDFSFTESMKEILDDIKTRANAKRINFNADIDPLIGAIKGVRLYIEEAIMNLLANSVKYTNVNGEIYFQAEDKRHYILIKIKDSGIGVPKDELPYIFDEFYRARNAKAIEKMGTGLGLSITKEIVELHKGRIWVESEENKGTTFYIELPK